MFRKPVNTVSVTLDDGGYNRYLLIVHSANSESIFPDVTDMSVETTISFFVPFPNWMPQIRQGDILLIEDTEVWAGDLESHLAKLKICGVFDTISGLIIGKCRKYQDGGTGKKFYEFIYDYLDKTEIPMLAECDFSHCAPMLTIPIGFTAELDADRTIDTS